MNHKKFSRKAIISCAVLVVLLLVVSAYFVYPDALAGTISGQYLPSRLSCFYCP